MPLRAVSRLAEADSAERPIRAGKRITGNRTRQAMEDSLHLSSHRQIGRQALAGLASAPSGNGRAAGRIQADTRPVCGEISVSNGRNPC